MLVQIWYDAESSAILPELLPLDIDRNSFSSQSEFEDYILDYLMSNGYGDKTNLTWQAL